jgi:hypothetical protein
MDFTTSGWSTPRRFPAVETFNDFNTEILQRKTERLLNSVSSKTRIEVRRLEDKVARVAAKKCSVEEVSFLYKELEDWLITEKDDQVRPFDSDCRMTPSDIFYQDLFSFSQCGPVKGYPHESSSPFRGK